MKTFKFNIHTAIMAALVLVSTLGFTSCDDDDNKTPQPTPSLSQLNGEYTGKMTFITLEKEGEEENSGTDITATVKNDTIYFNDFPVKDIITSIVGEENSEAIIEAIGKVEYKIGYKAEMNEDKTEATMKLDPKPLTLKFSLTEETVTNIEVSVSATNNNGSYTFLTKDMKFEITADEVKVNDEVFPKFKKSLFNFIMNNGK